MYIMELRIQLTGSICSTCKGKRSPPILAEQRKTTVLEAVSRRLKPIETGFVGACRASGIFEGTGVGGDGEGIGSFIVTKLLFTQHTACYQWLLLLGWCASGA